MSGVVQKTGRKRSAPDHLFPVLHIPEDSDNDAASELNILILDSTDKDRPATATKISKLISAEKPHKSTKSERSSSADESEDDKNRERISQTCSINASGSSKNTVKKKKPGHGTEKSNLKADEAKQEESRLAQEFGMKFNWLENKINGSSTEVAVQVLPLPTSKTKHTKKAKRRSKDVKVSKHESNFENMQTEAETRGDETVKKRGDEIEERKGGFEVNLSSNICRSTTADYDSTPMDLSIKDAPHKTDLRGLINSSSQYLQTQQASQSTQPTTHPPPLSSAHSVNSQPIPLTPTAIAQFSTRCNSLNSFSSSSDRAPALDMQLNYQSSKFPANDVRWYQVHKAPNVYQQHRDQLVPRAALSKPMLGQSVHASHNYPSIATQAHCILSQNRPCPAPKSISVPSTTIFSSGTPLSGQSTTLSQTHNMSSQSQISSQLLLSSLSQSQQDGQNNQIQMATHRRDAVTPYSMEYLVSSTPQLQPTIRKSEQEFRLPQHCPTLPALLPVTRPSPLNRLNQQKHQKLELPNPPKLVVIASSSEQPAERLPVKQLSPTLTQNSTAASTLTQQSRLDSGVNNSIGGILTTKASSTLLTSCAMGGSSKMEEVRQNEESNRIQQRTRDIQALIQRVRDRNNSKSIVSNAELHSGSGSVCNVEQSKSSFTSEQVCNKHEPQAENGTCIQDNKQTSVNHSELEQPKTLRDNVESQQKHYQPSAKEAYDRENSVHSTMAQQLTQYNNSSTKQQIQRTDSFPSSTREMQTLHLSAHDNSISEQHVGQSAVVQSKPLDTMQPQNQQIPLPSTSRMQREDRLTEQDQHILGRTVTQFQNVLSTTRQVSGHDQRDIHSSPSQHKVPEKQYKIDMAKSKNSHGVNFVHIRQQTGFSIEDQQATSRSHTNQKSMNHDAQQNTAVFNNSKQNTAPQLNDHLYGSKQAAAHSQSSQPAIGSLQTAQLGITAERKQQRQTPAHVDHVLTREALNSTPVYDKKQDSKLLQTNQQLHLNREQNTVHSHDRTLLQQSNAPSYDTHKETTPSQNNQEPTRFSYGRQQRNKPVHINQLNFETQHHSPLGVRSAQNMIQQRMKDSENVQQVIRPEQGTMQSRNVQQNVMSSHAAHIGTMPSYNVQSTISPSHHSKQDPGHVNGSPLASIWRQMLEHGNTTTPPVPSSEGTQSATSTDPHTNNGNTDDQRIVCHKVKPRGQPGGQKCEGKTENYVRDLSTSSTLPLHSKLTSSNDSCDDIVLRNNQHVISPNYSVAIQHSQQYMQNSSNSTPQTAVQHTIQHSSTATSRSNQHTLNSIQQNSPNSAVITPQHSSMMHKNTQSKVQHINAILPQHNTVLSMNSVQKNTPHSNAIVPQQNVLSPQGSTKPQHSNTEPLLGNTQLMSPHSTDIPQQILQHSNAFIAQHGNTGNYTHLKPQHSSLSAPQQSNTLQLNSTRQRAPHNKATTPQDSTITLINNTQQNAQHSSVIMQQHQHAAPPLSSVQQDMQHINVMTQSHIQQIMTTSSQQVPTTFHYQPHNAHLNGGFFRSMQTSTESLLLPESVQSSDGTAAAQRPNVQQSETSAHDQQSMSHNTTAPQTSRQHLHESTTHTHSRAGDTVYEQTATLHPQHHTTAIEQIDFSAFELDDIGPMTRLLMQDF